MGDMADTPEVDVRLRADLRADMVKLQGLLASADAGATGALDKVTIMRVINENCKAIAERSSLIQLALERADTDGTGSKINLAVAQKQLSKDLLIEMDNENLAAAREALKDKRAALVEQTESRVAKPGFIEAHKLREMFAATPFAMSADVVGSIMRFFGVKDEAGDSVRTSEIMRTLCPMLDQAVFSAINAKVTAKYGSLKTAFDALSKTGTISRQQFAELLEALPLDALGLNWDDIGPSRPMNCTEIKNEALEAALSTKNKFTQAEFEKFKLPSVSQDSFVQVGDKYFKPVEDKQLQPNEIQDLLNLADADGSGSIEYKELQVVFGTGELFARARQENYKRLQAKSALTATVRTDSIASTASTRSLSPEERVAVVLGSRSTELVEALKAADAEGKGKLILKIGTSVLI